MIGWRRKREPKHEHSPDLAVPVVRVTEIQERATCGCGRSIFRAHRKVQTVSYTLLDQDWQP